jgi:hypothetical protein
MSTPPFFGTPPSSLSLTHIPSLSHVFRYGYHSGADGWRQFSAPKSLVHLPGTTDADDGGSAADGSGGVGGVRGRLLVVAAARPLALAAAALAAGVVLGVAAARVHR